MVIASIVLLTQYHRCSWCFTHKHASSYAEGCVIEPKQISVMFCISKSMYLSAYLCLVTWFTTHIFNDCMTVVSGQPTNGWNYTFLCHFRPQINQILELNDGQHASLITACRGGYFILHAFHSKYQSQQKNVLPYLPGTSPKSPQ